MDCRKLQDFLYSIAICFSATKHTAKENRKFQNKELDWRKYK